MHDSPEQIVMTIPDEMRGYRLDKALAELLPSHSRSALQQWLKDGRITVNGDVMAQKFKLTGGESLHVSVPEPEAADWPAQPMAIDLVATDDDFYVINKPAGLVVHPGAGNSNGTLMNGLLCLDDNLRKLPRAGIVHRLDKDTTGLMVVARSENARQSFIDQLKNRSMGREYIAIVNGVLISGETIDEPIGRHRQDRFRMCVTDSGKPAITHLRVEQKFRLHSVVRAKLESGRTHQIRVHMQWRGYPLVGDSTYGGRQKIPANASEELTKTLQSFTRQALHATQLSFQHPVTAEVMTYQQQLPEDMATLLAALSTDHITNQQ